DGVAAGENLAGKFRALPDHRWQLRLARPINDLPRGELVVSVKDGQGNVSRVERTFSVSGGKKCHQPDAPARAARAGASGWYGATATPDDGRSNGMKRNLCAL